HPGETGRFQHACGLTAAVAAPAIQEQLLTATLLDRTQVHFADPAQRQEYAPDIEFGLFRRLSHIQHGRILPRLPAGMQFLYGDIFHIVGFYSSVAGNVLRTGWFRLSQISMVCPGRMRLYVRSYDNRVGLCRYTQAFIVSSTSSSGTTAPVLRPRVCRSVTASV